MMSMMENFFSIRKNSESIFEGLAITEHGDFCKEWMNQYPVLFISFKDAEAEAFESAYKMLGTSIADLCKKLLDVEGSASVNQADRDVFNRLTYQKAEEQDIKNALKTIMRMMNAVYGKKVILLIDEYDVPLAKASEKDNSKRATECYPSARLEVITGGGHGFAGGDSTHARELSLEFINNIVYAGADR